MTQCTAKSKRTGQRCRDSAMVGKTVCYHHGGKTPVGPALPQYISGKYSKYLPQRLQARYDEATRDGEKLALDAEIALIDSRLTDVLLRVDTGESGQLWSDLKATHQALMAARQASDQAGMAIALTQIGDLIGKGHADWAAWSDVRSLVRDRAMLVEREQKRLVAAQQMITSGEAMALVTALVAAVTDHVSDRTVLAAITADVARLIGRPLDGRTVAPGRSSAEP